MGSCQNYGPFLGTLNIRCRSILRIQKGTIILTTTHICKGMQGAASVIPEDYEARVDEGRLESHKPLKIKGSESLLDSCFDRTSRF